jgi:Fur family ferric uptake transcriptional regulator
MTRRQHRLQSANLASLAERLHRGSRRLTGPRRAILEILRQRARPMSAREIFNSLPVGASDLATVHRAVRLLEAMSMVKRFELGGGASRYELLAEGDDGHHHHLVCTRCAAVVEIEECFPHELQDRVAARNGFKSVTHKLEFFGVCPACQ